MTTHKLARPPPSQASLLQIGILENRILVTQMSEKWVCWLFVFLRGEKKGVIDGAQISKAVFSQRPKKEDEEKGRKSS